MGVVPVAASRSSRGAPVESRNFLPLIVVRVPSSDGTTIPFFKPASPGGAGECAADSDPPAPTGRVRVDDVRSSERRTAAPAPTLTLWRSGGPAVILLFPVDDRDDDAATIEGGVAEEAAVKAPPKAELRVVSMVVVVVVVLVPVLGPVVGMVLAVVKDGIGVGAAGFLLFTTLLWWKNS